MNYYLRKSGVVSGPFPEEDIRRRLTLNLLTSMDEASTDGVSWKRIRQTPLWQPASAPRTAPATTYAGAPGPAATPRRAPTTPAALHLRRVAKQGAMGNADGPVSAGGTSSPYEPFPQTASTPSVPPPLPSTPQPSPYSFAPAKPVYRERSRFHNWWLALAIPCATLVILVIILALIPDKRGSNTGGDSSAPSEATFKAAQDKLAIIECGGGSGSGFLAKMNGQVYLVSNEHVFRGADAPKATLLDGTVLELGAFSVAEDRDLARFEVSNVTVGFTISDDSPSTSDFCAIYGNSGGQGVATELTGKVTGVGPRTIETDAEFIGGNSGSPMLNAKGEVIGAADRVFNAKATNEIRGDWGAKDTQFDSVRRFAARLNSNVRWLPLNRREYERQVAKFEAFALFQKYLDWFYFIDMSEGEEPIPQFNEQDAQAFEDDPYRFAKCLSDVAKAYEKRERAAGGFFRLWATLDKMESEKEKESFFKENDMAAKWMKTKDLSNAFISQLEQALAHGRSFLERNHWEAPQLREGHNVDSSTPDGTGVVYWIQAFKYAENSIAQRKRNLEKFIREFEGMDDDD